MSILDTLLIEVMPQEAAFAQLRERVRETTRTGKPDKYSRFTFHSPEAMARALTPLRWSMVQAMTGAGPLGVRELARRLGRDVKAVHTDANALAAVGLIDRTEDGKYLFPYKRVKVAFELRAAA